MPRPVTTVEIAFNVGVTGTPTWTDVTSKVRADPGISIEHWRGEEDDETQASRCSLVLRNDDGRFTPGNTAGAHYPNVKRNRPIRVRSTHNGVTYTRFTGYIDDWAVEWPATVGTISDCSVSASSRSSRLARGVELRSIVEEEYLLDNPVAYYTLGEPEGATTAADSSGVGAPQLVQRGTGTAVVFGTATGPGTDDLTAATFAGGQYLETDGQVGPIAAVEFFFSRNGTPSDYEPVVAVTDGTTQIAFMVSNLGAPVVGKNGLFGGPGGVNVADGETHHVYWEPGTGNRIIDGVSGTFAQTLSGALSVSVGGWTDTSFSTLRLTGVVAHVAAYGAAVAEARVANHEAAGLTGFDGETSADRIERLAGYAGVPTADLDLTGSTPIAHFDTTGMTALDAMRKVEVTEGGVLYDALDGKLAFRGRDARYNTSSAFAVSIAAGEAASAPHPVLDDQRQVNDMTATNADGVIGRIFDQSSIDEDGLYRESVELATSDADEPLMRAGWVVGRYAEAPQRISDLEILLNTASNTLAAGVLSSQVGTKFTLTGLPSNAPASSMVLFVEGRAEQITMDEDRVTLRTSPAELFDVFVLDSSTLGVLDSNRLAY